MNYIEWLDVSYQTDNPLAKDELEQRAILATAGFFYDETKDFYSTALTYITGDQVKTVIHIPKNMALVKKEVALRPLNLDKLKMKKDELLLIKVKYLDASKDYQLYNGAWGQPGIFCWTAGIATLFDNGVVSISQDFCPANGYFREIYHIPEQCIHEIWGAKVKFVSKN